jgi:WD40 repeat protein
MVVVGGDSFIHFWSDKTHFPAIGLLRRVGNLYRPSQLEPITALQSLKRSGRVISASAAGHLSLWDEVNCIKHLKCHNGTINCLYASEVDNRPLLVSAGIDMKVRLWWDEELEAGPLFDIEQFGSNPIVRGLCVTSDRRPYRIAIGTRDSNIFEISVTTGACLQPGPIVVGHAIGDLTCVAVHPCKTSFVSVGTDGTLRLFETDTHIQSTMARFKGFLSAVIIVVG